MVGLFALLIWRGLRIGLRAPDAFGSYLALGLTLMLATQTLVNLGVVTGALPTKGLPLPFISFGGSALLMTMFSAGVLLNISARATASHAWMHMFKKYQQIHFVGIGGVGMSGIAEVLLNLGYRITGSDARRNEAVERLERLGAKVFTGHLPAHVEGAHVVVYSSAVAADNVEVQVARQRGIPVIARAEMLAELMRLKYGIAIAGTHGKTTTTSLVAAVLGAGGFDPTVVVGGRVHGLGTNARLGQGEFLVAEADESDGSFLKLSPTIAVVTTVDAEHLDHYADLDAIRAAFTQFVNKVPFYGAAVLCLDEPNIQQMIPAIDKRVVTLRARVGRRSHRAAARRSPARRSKFEVVHRGRVLGPASLQVPGRHNVLNALAAVAVGLDLEMPFDAHPGRARRLPGRPAPLSDPRRGPGRARRGRLRPSSRRDPRHARRRQGRVRPARDHGVPAAPLHADAAPAPASSSPRSTSPTC